MIRSERRYPLAGLDLGGGLQQAWEKGWLDEFSDEHFLIRAIEKRLDSSPKFYQLPTQFTYPYSITSETFQENFCINFSSKIMGLITLFGADNIRGFFTDQLSAGKANYEENQFFRALSEVSVLSYWRINAKSGVYEPKTNGNKNPEARIHCNNDITVDIEVKTPGFKDFDDIDDIVIPTVLLDDEGRKRFMDFCKLHGLNGSMPRVMKIKDFLNSAAEKFEEVDHVNHMNLLYVNWTLSEFVESGYQEAYSLMAHPINGILKYKELGLSIGIHEEVYNKITAVIVYTESLHSLMFGDFRWVWIRGDDGQPHFGVIGMHNCEELSKTIGMDPYAKQLTPVMTGIFRDTVYVHDLIALINGHMLRL